MTVHPQARPLALIALMVLAGLGPAQAADDVFGEPLPYRARAVGRPVRFRTPVIISGYLPRNNAVPLYNEPSRRPAYGYGR